MAYNPNLPAGTYRARALQADCYPTKNGEGLMLGVEWVVSEGEYEGSQITGGICLIDNSGNPTKNYENTREWAKSWNGIDTDYFKGHFSEWDVEIKVERKVIETKELDANGNPITKEVPEVKWVNDPNSSHGANITAGDHRKLGAKFGSKLKALAANYNRQHQGTAPAAKAEQARTPAKTATSAAPAPATPAKVAHDGDTPKFEIAWEKFKEKNPTLEGEDRNTAWFELVGKFTDSTDYRNLPDEVWDQVLGELEMPF